MALPSLFLSHGAPTLPLDDVPAREFLKALGTRIGRPRAIVIASGHWDTKAPRVTDDAVNPTIHDFYGFPEALYRISYPAPGDAALSARVAKLTGAMPEPGRGLDHGAWVPLMLMYPDAGIPVVQLSIQSPLGAAHHIALGRALAPLRDDNVLVIGSGGFVHNLRQLERMHPERAVEPEWSKEFSDWMHDKLMARDDAALAAWRSQAPHARIAQPTEDHFLPLFVAYGAGGERIERLHQSVTFGSLRMDAYAFG
jgi:4,5-DOPA dioxygenase extradiol